jgi:4-hydroxy-2-oxoheptanedioate aldolase
MRRNQALARWRAGEQTIGGWLQLACAHSAELMANVGYDWLCADMQHGLIDYDDLLYILPAVSTTETTPLVRVAGNIPSQIMKVLDAGAMGVIVPLVNTREEAAAAVSACRYPPKGLRSFGPIRAALYGGRGYAAEANDEIACIVMTETREAVANIDEIVTTPGVDGIYIGPNDLALSLGLPPRGDTEDELHMTAVKAVLAAAKRHGLPAGIHTSSPEWARRRLDMGFNYVVAGSDAGLIAQGAAQALGAVKAAVKKTESTGY